MRRTKEEAQETRRTVLAAARKLFVQKGYSATTLEDIAEEAGFTRGAVYWHFQNKSGVLKALQAEENTPMQQLLGKLILDETLDPFTALRNIVQTFLIELTEQPEKRQLLRVIFEESLTHQRPLEPSEAEQCENDVMEMARQILKQAEMRGQLAAPWTPKTAALAFHSLVKGMISSWLYETAMFDLAAEGAPAIGNFLESLRRI